jgi:hypothetical protein
MSGRYLLDTNIIIALFAEEVSVKTRLAQAAPRKCSFRAWRLGNCASARTNRGVSKRIWRASMNSPQTPRLHRLT